MLRCSVFHRILQHSAIYGLLRFLLQGTTPYSLMGCYDVLSFTGYSGVLPLTGCYDVFYFTWYYGTLFKGCRDVLSFTGPCKVLSPVASMFSLSVQFGSVALIHPTMSNSIKNYPLCPLFYRVLRRSLLRDTMMFSLLRSTGYDVLSYGVLRCSIFCTVQRRSLVGIITMFSFTEHRLRRSLPFGVQHDILSFTSLLLLLLLFFLRDTVALACTGVL